MVTPGTCTYCNDVTGYRISVFGVWEEICGDGLNFGETEWDDANSLDGDGWSSIWKLETGFKWNGTYWYEIVSPTAIVGRVSADNVVTFAFSEPVKFR